MASKRITDFKPHKANANKGSERGEYMIEASLREVGAWRSVGADRNGTIGVGNKTTQKWQEIANPDDVIIVPTDGTKLVIVQRTDLDFDSDDPAVVERTVKAAYFDNRAAEVSMTWDADQVLADLTAGLDLSGLWFEHELDALINGIGGEVVDPAQEWQGMPEFVQEDQTSFRRIVVHFANQQDVDSFAKLVGQKFGEKTRAIWYPEAAKTNMKDIYVES
jgi:hypothetical protein